MFENQAIIVKNVTKIYGKELKVLDGLNLSVSKGSIYGLLGASGCGKTTLLSCIVGICKINSGDIWVLGGKPGSENSGIPGSRVGFMPQNISLVNEFSTIGAFYYFGRINGLRDDEIEERYVDLAELLQLPSKHQLIKNVSGGQQRRISFAAALLHRPELLILDEPTVGLDPILRDNIWNFLTKITQENGVTIVITTHYIDEARQASKIGLLRCGKLLAETTPNQLMDRFQCDNLENAFLELSRRQQDNINRNVNDNSEMLDETEFVEGSINLSTKSMNASTKSMNASTKSTTNLSVMSRRLKALIIKNITQFLRHPGGILFSIGFPIIQLLVFHYSFGHDPKDLLIGVINRESNNCDFGKNQGNIIYTQNDICDFFDLSCRFLNNINDTTAKKIFYNYLPEMKDDLRKGKLSGMIYFDTNFTQALQRRLKNSRYVEDRDIEMGEIKIWLDMSNRQIGLFLKNKLYETYFESMRNIMTECHLPSKITNIPLSFEKPIFGKKNDDYINFSAPTFILSLTFFVTTVMTTMILISDRHEGIWERSLVQGVTTSEILFSHFVVELSIVIIQVILICSISFFYFNLDCKGSLVTVVTMVFFMGVCGLFYGFLISVFCNSHLIADYIVTGSFYPIILLSGFLWPIEGIPSAIKWLSYCLPTTIPGVSLRAILNKGHSVNNPEVYKGFLVIGGWTSIMILLCLYGLKKKS